MKKTAKRLLSILSLSILLLCAAPASALAAPGEIVLFDKATDRTATILLSSDANEAETGAAEILSRYMTEMTGRAPAVASEPPSPEDAYISVAQTGQPAAEGAYRLYADGAGIRIEAGTARGLANGVYGFLRDCCGCGWYAPEVKVIPKTETLAAPADLDKTYAPPLENADLYWISARDEVFALANGLNGSVSPIPAVFGGTVRYLGFVHTLTNLIVPAGELFDTHPEYFAYRKASNEREDSQLCLSNPDALDRAISDTLSLIENDSDAAGGLRIVSVSQADNESYCECDACAALAEQYGGQSGLMIWFVNQIADAVAAAGHSDVIVDTLAYTYTRHAPENIAPHDNVCVRLCSIECCFAHALEDSSCEENRAFMQDLENWSKLCSRLYVWDYTTNFAQTHCIYPNFGVLQANMQTFTSHNVVGLFEQGMSPVDAFPHVEFSALRAYLLAALMRDPDCDLNAERDAFLAAYYGEGADEIAEFLDFITAHAGDEAGHLGFKNDAATSLHGVTKTDAARCDALWQKALKETQEAGQEEENLRARHSLLSWRYWEACAKLGDFADGIAFWKRPAANRALYNEILDTGVEMYHETIRMDQLHFLSVSRPSDWLAPRGLFRFCVGVVCLLAVLTAVAVVWKKRYVYCAILPLTAAIMVDFYFSEQLFIEWRRLIAYFATIAFFALAFGVVTAFADAGLNRRSGKIRRTIDIVVGALLAFIPFEVILSYENNVRTNGKWPEVAAMMACFWLLTLGALLLTIIIIRLLKKNPPEKG